MMIEGLSFILNNFFNMSLFLVIDLYFLDAVVCSKIALEVMSEEIDKFLHLFSVIFQIAQNLWNEIVQLRLYLFG